ncbi:ImcF-related family protein, partial [Enterobacter hormaechei]|uniref:ImcF-related family protein n=2 Tax=Enterobacterales TaxID=91347 RepID=UPI0023B7ED26
LKHTDWQAQRKAGEVTAINAFTPFTQPINTAQKELSRLPLYQRVYQTLRLKANQVLSSPLNIRHQVGPSFDSIFTAINEDKLQMPQLLTL